MLGVIQEKNWDFSVLIDMLMGAREMNDDVQIKKIARRGVINIYLIFKHLHMDLFSI